MAHLTGSGTLCRLRVVFAKQPHRSTHCTHSGRRLRCGNPGNRPLPHRSMAFMLIQQGTMCGSLAKSGIGEQKRPSALTDQVSGAVGKQIRPSMLTERSGGGVCEQNQPSMFTDQAPGVACEQNRSSMLTDWAEGGPRAEVVLRGKVECGRNSAFCESGAGGKTRARSGLTASVRALVRTAPRD